jgi:predicted nuclease with TOPRIM domain
MKKYQELETKVKELQEEIERLKQEEEEQEDKLPEGFDRDYALNFLKNYSCFNLQMSFVWSKTPPGEDYWKNIYKSLKDNPKYVVPDEVIIQIQKWVILSFLE